MPVFHSLLREESHYEIVDLPLWLRQSEWWNLFFFIVIALATSVLTFFFTFVHIVSSSPAFEFIFVYVVTGVPKVIIVGSFNASENLD